MQTPENGVKGRIHSFLSMGAVDGPGLRYVVFLQGCPLRCACCHNPDTWNAAGGTEYTVEDVLRRVRRCKPYIYESGGVTVTGGEPLAQPVFTAALLKALRAEGYHTALDTSGAGALAAAREVLAHTDLVLADLKFSSEEGYRAHTGGSLAHTLDFLALTQELGVPLWVRHVVIPGLTDGEAHIRALARICRRWSCWASESCVWKNTGLWAFRSLLRTHRRWTPQRCAGWRTRCGGSCRTLREKGAPDEKTVARRKRVW